MDSRAVVERIIRNLDFDLDTAPKYTTADTCTTSSKNSPINVKIKVRKKENPKEPSNQGFVSNNLSEPEMVLRKVRLVNSDETIMTFDMFMEAESDKKTLQKSRRIFAMLKPGICLSGTDDDEGPYMPNSNSFSKSDGVLRQQYALPKNTCESFVDSHMTRKETNFLGRKCKPGGCLDPPFGEDRYPYRPHIQKPGKTEEYMKSPPRLKTDESGLENRIYIKQYTKDAEKDINMYNEPLIKMPFDIGKSGSIQSSKESSNITIITYKSDSKSLKTRRSYEDKESKYYRDRYSPDLQSDNKSKYPQTKEICTLRPIVLNREAESKISDGKSKYPHANQICTLKSKLSCKDSENKINDDKLKQPHINETSMLKSRVPSEDDNSKYPHGNEISMLKSGVSSENAEYKISGDKSKYLHVNDMSMLRSRVPNNDAECKISKDKSDPHINQIWMPKSRVPNGIALSKIHRNRDTGEDKSKRASSDEINVQTNRSDSKNENKLHNRSSLSGNNRYRQSINESINSFFSLPKGVKRESNRRALKQIKLSNMHAVKSKPSENLRIPVPDSISVDSVTSEPKESSKIVEDMHFDTHTMPEEQHPVSENIDEKQMKHLLTPIPIPIPFFTDPNQIDECVYSNTNLSIVKPKEDSSVSSKIPLTSAPSSNSTISFKNILISEQNVKLDKTNLETSLLDQSISPLWDTEPVAKEDKVTVLEESSSSTGEAIINSYNQSATELHSKSDIAQHDIIKEVNKQEQQGQLNYTDNHSAINEPSDNIMKKNEDEIMNMSIKSSPVSLADYSSVTKGLDELTENTYLNSKQSIPNIPLVYLDENKTSVPIKQNEITTRKSYLAPESQQSFRETIKNDSVQYPKQMIAPKKSVSESSSKIQKGINSPAQVPTGETLTKNIKRSFKSTEPNIRQIIKSENYTVKNIRNSSDLNNSFGLNATLYKSTKQNKSDESLDPAQVIIPLDTNKSPLTMRPKPASKTEEDHNLKYNILSSTDITKDNVYLNLAFHSYLDNQNKRILNTFDPRCEVQRHPNDSITLINSACKNNQGAVISIDSKHDMSIKLKKINNTITSKDCETQTKPIPKIPQSYGCPLTNGRANKVASQKEPTPINENDRACNRLTKIYEQELMPLQTLMRNLIQEIDSLTAQQTACNKKVTSLQKPKLRPIMNCNRHYNAFCKLR